MAQARLCDALGGSAALLVDRCAHDHLIRAEVEPVVLSIVEITESTASAHVSAVRQLRAGFPSLPVLAYCDPSGGTSSIVDVVRAGAASLLLRGVDDTPARCRDAIMRARRSAIAERVFGELAPLLSNDGRVFLRYAIEHCATDVSVDQAARDLGVDRKTLTNWLARAGAPRAREFLSWVRLAVAAHLMSDPGRSAEHVAHMLDFPSGTALRNMVRRYVDVTTAELQQRGGAHLVLEAFKRHLAARPPGRGARPIAATRDAPAPALEVSA
jgi:AraC-like DNA-binding protein